MFFASNAIYPISIMPNWLQDISRINPLSYEVDGIRTLMLSGGSSSFGLGLDFGLLLVITAVLVGLAGRLYPHLVT
jgi:ABC-2 type transport system permease protein